MNFDLIIINVTSLYLKDKNVINNLFDVHLWNIKK